MRAFDRLLGFQRTDGFACRLAAARGGSREALGELLEPLRHYLMIVAQAEMNDCLCAKMTPADAVQQTFLRAQQALDDFSGQSEHQWRGWLRRILLNEIAQSDRYFRHTAKRFVGREVALADGDSHCGAWQLPSADETPSTRAMANEDQDRLQRAIERLPVDQRRVVELRNARMSFEQIAPLLQRSAAAAQKLWSRALDNLRREFGEAEST